MKDLNEAPQLPVNSCYITGGMLHLNTEEQKRKYIDINLSLSVSELIRDADPDAAPVKLVAVSVCEYLADGTV